MVYFSEKKPKVHIHIEYHSNQLFKGSILAKLMII